MKTYTVTFKDGSKYIVNTETKEVKQIKGVK